MPGYCYHEKPPTVCCPWCGADCSGTAEYVDIGVGMEQVTPHGCQACQSVEISPFDERDPGYYEIACARIAAAVADPDALRRQIRGKGKK